MPKHTLTGNDLARAESGIALALAWWERRSRGEFGRNEIVAYKALLAKLSEISDHAYPYEPDCMPSDWTGSFSNTKTPGFPSHCAGE